MWLLFLVSIDAHAIDFSPVCNLLENYQLQCFLRTSGGKGLHLVVPLERKHSWDELKKFAHAVADELVSQQPQRYIATMSKAKRHGKIFIDYLRNQRGATAIASYSTRARSHCPIATPVSWSELNSRLSPDKYHLGNILNRLHKLETDPWAEFFTVKQKLPGKYGK